MEKQHICYQDKSGKPAFREATTEELAAMAITPVTNWHKKKPIRIVIPSDVRAKWLMQKQENDLIGTYPEIGAILDYIKMVSVSTVVENDTLYVYLDEIYDQHRAIIEKNGATVELKAV